MSLSIKDRPRADDDRILTLLARAHRGERLSDIEADLGITAGAATVIIRRVQADDLKYSGEPEATVRAAYRRKPRRSRAPQDQTTPNARRAA